MNKQQLAKLLLQDDVVRLFGLLTRIDLIDHRTMQLPAPGRILSIWDDQMKIEVSIQDEGRTIKVFLVDRE